MPESPRFLLCQGRTEEALEVFDQIARWNGRPCVNPSDVKVLQAAILLGNGDKSEKESGSPSTAFTTGQCCVYRYLPSTFTSFKVFRYRQYRFQLLVLIFSWFASQLIYYGISFNMKNLTSGDAYLNVLYMGIVSLPGSFTGLLFNNR